MEFRLWTIYASIKFQKTSRTFSDAAYWELITAYFF